MRRSWVWPLLFAVGSSLACTSIVEELPGGAAGNPVSPAPITNPSPVPLPSATPTPPPAATPTPEPTPPPTSASCAPGPGDGEDCPRVSPQFLDMVTLAIDQLADKRPDLFDFKNTRGDGGWLVKDGEAYHWGVVDELRAMGVCATYDGEEVAVKVNNDFSDQYDIHLSTGHVRRGEGSYRATCRPAWF